MGVLNNKKAPSLALLRIDIFPAGLYNEIKQKEQRLNKKADFQQKGAQTIMKSEEPVQFWQVCAD